MTSEINLERIVIGDLELVLRPADARDLSFCYELMSHNMKDLFNRNTQEKWSRVKFKSGFKPERITIVGHDGMSIGYYDYEILGDQLYWHNIQISDDFQIGVGSRVVGLLEKAAEMAGAKVITGKVFCDNLRIVRWIQGLGFQVDGIIEEENSYWMKKYLGDKS